MNNRRNNNRGKTNRSQCGDVILRGTNHQLVEKYEGLAYQADRDKDHVMTQTYFQHADHYKREINV